MRTYVITGSWERSADLPVCAVDFIVGLEPWEEAGRSGAGDAGGRRVGGGLSVQGLTTGRI